MTGSLALPMAVTGKAQKFTMREMAIEELDLQDDLDSHRSGSGFSHSIPPFGSGGGSGVVGTARAGLARNDSSSNRCHPQLPVDRFRHDASTGYEAIDGIVSLGSLHVYDRSPWVQCAVDPVGMDNAPESFRGSGGPVPGPFTMRDRGREPS